MGKLDDYRENRARELVEFAEGRYVKAFSDYMTADDAPELPEKWGLAETMVAVRFALFMAERAAAASTAGRLSETSVLAAAMDDHSCPTCHGSATVRPFPCVTCGGVKMRDDGVAPAVGVGVKCPACHEVGLVQIVRQFDSSKGGVAVVVSVLSCGHEMETEKAVAP